MTGMQSGHFWHGSLDTYMGRKWVSRKIARSYGWIVVQEYRYIAKYIEENTTALLRGERKQELRAGRGPFYREPVASDSKNISGLGT